jgi:ornithine carbamoyltransferase
MASKTLFVAEKAVHQESSMLAQASVTLAGRDLCSIADLSQAEIAAVMELAHAIKATPGDYRYSLDARQMVMFFEKASLRTRLTFEAGMNTLAVRRCSWTKRNRRWESANRWPTSRATWSAG